MSSRWQEKRIWSINAAACAGLRSSQVWATAAAAAKNGAPKRRAAVRIQKLRTLQANRLGRVGRSVTFRGFIRCITPFSRQALFQSKESVQLERGNSYFLRQSGKGDRRFGGWGVGDWWNLLEGGAYYLAGGGPCFATDVGPQSPLAGDTARSAGRRSSLPG